MDEPTPMDDVRGLLEALAKIEDEALRTEIVTRHRAIVRAAYGTGLRDGKNAPMDPETLAAAGTQVLVPLLHTVFGRLIAAGAQITAAQAVSVCAALGVPAWVEPTAVPPEELN